MSLGVNFQCWLESCRCVDIRSQVGEECTPCPSAHLCHLVSTSNVGLNRAGVLTSDPRLVKSARPVPLLTYDEATELAFFGATVLHPQAMQPAFQQQFHNGHRLAVRVKNSYNRYTMMLLLCWLDLGTKLVGWTLSALPYLCPAWTVYVLCVPSLPYPACSVLPCPALVGPALPCSTPIICLSQGE